MKVKLLAIVFAGVLALSAFAGTAFAKGTPGGGDHPNPNACFGQFRAAFAVSSQPGAVGDLASILKGDNSMNAAFRAAGCPNIPGGPLP